MIGWHFPVDHADQWDGFNQAGIEHFRGNRFGNLAREVIQNSLDAAAGDQVVVEFEVADVETSSIPGIEHLRVVAAECLAAAEAEGAKAKQFFLNAHTLLNASRVPVLTITERNTKGIAGPSHNGTPYYAYVKATGQSKKDNETATGSYGIGKFAPFAISALRTIFISTIFETAEGGFSQLTQGKAILMSHQDEMGRTHQGTGYWGIVEGCQPVEGDDPHIPAWLKRAPLPSQFSESVGSTFHVLGFERTLRWEKILAAYVLQSYFGALWTDKLLVRVGERTISKATVRDDFQDNSLTDAVGELKGQPEEFTNARWYLEALARTEESQVEHTESHDLGLTEVQILTEEQLPKRVAVLRNGMFITDQLDRLKRFSEYKEFAAVVQCHSDKGNELLRAMEPPRHDAFEPDRLDSKEEQKRGRRALNELARWVREMLKRHAQDPVAEVTVIRELADYFAEEEAEGNGQSGTETNPLGGIRIRAQPLRRKSVPVLLPEGPETDEGGGPADGPTDTEGGDSGEGPGPGNRGTGHSGIPVELRNLRSVRIGASRRRIAFTPGGSGIVQLAVFEAGADTDRALQVTHSSAGVVRSPNKVELMVERDVRQTMEIELGEEFPGAMKVLGYEV